MDRVDANSMRITNDVNLPEKLVAAQQAGHLVVFAGAGVSMGAPSNLPDFRQLAERIAGVARKPDEGEPLDRFLGRLADNGTDVQRRARTLIDLPHSEPTTLHRELVRLFRAQEEVRIVTTNFDRHFESAYRAEWEEGTLVYHAPALPLGSDFHGLVQLHGAVSAGHPLVLTDTDFGKAYLTSGWATRFLLELFATYTVLFVGYSHNDIVMQYLARSLPPNRAQRFALVPAPASTLWDYLGIEAIPYPVPDASKDHHALGLAIEAWAKRTAMGVLDHEQRLSELGKLLPPVDPVDVDYVEAAFRNEEQQRFLFRVITDERWLEWLHERELLTSLLATGPLPDTPSRERAWWLARTFACTHAGFFFKLLQSNHGQLCAEFWVALSHALAVAAPPPPAAVRSRWVGLLVSLGDTSWNWHPLALLLGRLDRPEEQPALVLLWGHLALPRVRLVKARSLEGQEATDALRVELKPLADHRQLLQAWRERLHPNLSSIHQLLLPTLFNALAQLRLLRSVDKEGTWDRESWDRRAIEPHPQDRYPDELDVVIDAMRGVVEWLLENERDIGVATRTLLCGANSVLMKRIGVHAWVADSRCTADEAVGALCDQRVA